MKFRYILIASLLVSGVGFTSHAQEGGLAERRAIAAYAKDTWPPLEKAIQDAAGFPVAVTLDLKSLALPGYADQYATENYLRKPVIDPIIKALAAVSADETGRAALKGKLKSIIIHYDEKTAPASNYRDGLSFKDGTLSVNWKPLSNVDDVQPRIVALTAFLESHL